MPALSDFSIARFEDGTLVITMTPPAPVQNQSIRFQVQHRFGGISGLITKSMASGFYSFVSGMDIGTSGVMNVQINGADTSGMDSSAVYSFSCDRLDAGNRTQLAAGNLLLYPDGGP